MRVIAIIIIYVLLFGIIVIAFIKRRDSSMSKFFSLVATVVLGVPSILTLFFPKEAVTVLHPDYQEYFENEKNIQEEIVRLELENEQLKTDYSAIIEKYNREKENQINTEIYDISLVLDGLEKSKPYVKGLAEIDGKEYYNSGLLKDLIGERPRFSKDERRVYLGDVEKVGKIEFQEVSNILYNGKVYWKYDRSDESYFTVAGKNYYSGFVIGCDQSLFGEGDGYALFNLNGNYSNMSFDVGKTDDYEIQNVSLIIVTDGEVQKECQLFGDTTSEHIEVPLNYTNDLKIQLKGGSRVKYGFFNVVFEL